MGYRLPDLPGHPSSLVKHLQAPHAPGLSIAARIVAVFTTVITSPVRSHIYTRATHHPPLHTALVLFFASAHKYRALESSLKLRL